MPSQINKPPEGFLDLLDLKAQGQNPNELLDGVRGVVDLFPFYAGMDTQSYNETVSAQISGIIRSRIVPTGEAWIPLMMSMEHICGNSNQYARMALTIANFAPDDGFGNALPREVYLKVGPYKEITTAGNPVVAVGDRNAIQFTFPRALVLRSQASINFRIVKENMTVPGTINMALWYYRFRV